MRRKRNTSRNILKKRTRYSDHGQIRKREGLYRDMTMRMEMGTLKRVDLEGQWNISMTMKGD
jgi:hypothetical protein